VRAYCYYVHMDFSSRTAELTPKGRELLDARVAFFFIPLPVLSLKLLPPPPRYSFTNGSCWDVGMYLGSYALRCCLLAKLCKVARLHHFCIPGMYLKGRGVAFRPVCKLGMY
jgi:hypothetical protein